MRYEHGTSPRKYDYDQGQKTKKVNKTQARPKVRKVVKKKNNFSKYLYIFGALFVAFAFIVSIRGSRIEEKNVKIQQSKKEVELLKNENAELKINLQKALSLTNIENQAKNKLGMKELDSNQIRYVKLDKQDYIEPVLITKVEEKKEPFYKKVIQFFTGVKE